jgi:hypothetical protein
VEFVFSAGEPASFECSLDGADYTPCWSPIDYVGLAEGLHFFSVRATDATGNVGAPAAWQWTISPG